MSRPGYWGTRDGGEIAYAAMETSHVRHALRYVRNRRAEFLAMPQTSITRSRIAYLESKLEELGNEAQRRQIIPQGDLTVEQLLEVVAEWQREWDTRARPSRQYHVGQRASPVTPEESLRAANAFLSAPTSAAVGRDNVFPLTGNNGGRITLGATPNLASPTRGWLDTEASPPPAIDVRAIQRAIAASQIKPFKKPPCLSKKIDVEVEVSRVTGLRIPSPIEMLIIEDMRRLDMDL